MFKHYVHYGSNEFNPLYFTPIRNRLLFNKPEGGLWASPCNSEWSWYEWCKSEGFNLEKLDRYFVFSIKKQSKFLVIKSHNDLVKLKENELCLDYSSTYPFTKNDFYLNFEKIVDLGYDAILVYIRDLTIYMDLYGWDCDSLLVLNPDCIITK